MAHHELKVGDAKYLGHVLLVDDVLRRVRIGLRLSISEDGLDLLGLGLGLFDGNLGGLDPLLVDLHDNFRRDGLDHGNDRSLEVLDSLRALHVGLDTLSSELVVLEQIGIPGHG